ncbi:hypothetical protein DFH07DRAFT_847094 [Mycena maculata]|uniref:Uncharacterized protein n=1 Tax=Mycena maculata TaxID=230809 RepID=A0AAD7MTQ5_9AGAR|nr:hypothetical protein DFH07DRAFT_847094 [Mycena maculata]
MPWARAATAFKRADASWRRMLVTQPPAQTVVIKSTSHGRDGDRERRGVLRDPSLRMGDLYDIALMCINQVAFSARIHWNKAGKADERQGPVTLLPWRRWISFSFATCTNKNLVR